MVRRIIVRGDPARQISKHARPRERRACRTLERVPLPRVDNEYLFRRLAQRLRVALVCDVGAFDGKHAKRFRAGELRVMAFEANPHCFAALANDPAIKAAGIELVHAAAWNETGTIRFNVVTSADKWRGSPRTSIGSVLERTPGHGLETYESVTVEAVRLDRCLAGEPGPIALWVDVEGAGYEVVEGIAGIRERVSIINIEVETQRFWQRQRLGTDIVRALREFGFIPIGRGSGGDLQFDVVFVNERWVREAQLTIRAAVAVASCRWAAYGMRARLLRLLRAA
jgi:FkbM family methyltransferase